MLEKIRNAVYGKKTYILSCVALVTALVAWASGELTDVQFVTAIFVALQTMFLRAGIAKWE
jgi:hypothetical protein